jgi:predicted PurR-regulated permease PerM
MPDKFNEIFEEARVFITVALWKMVKSYMIIMMITFMEVYAGLSILRIKYALPIAAIVAVLDILPVLGTGSVIIPWAIVELILKNYFLGFGLLILYVTVTVMRHAANKKIYTIKKIKRGTNLIFMGPPLSFFLSLP